MSVYVDQLIKTKPYHKSQNERWNWSQSCHMVADSEEELHEFARRLGLRREWFQNKHRNPLLWHYDLTANKRDQALRLGAKEITPEQFAQRIGLKPGNKDENQEQSSHSFTYEEAEQIIAQLKKVEVNGKHPFYAEEAQFFYSGVIYRIEIQTDKMSLLVELRKKHPGEISR